MDLTSILCPTDFSEASVHAAQQAGSIAGYYGSRITALHVITPMALAATGAATSTEEAAEVERARQRVEAQFGAATRAGLDVKVLVDVGSPAKLILERAAGLPAGLVVMGTHGASGFEHLILGSVTEKVLRKATCPVLTVPPRVQSTSRIPFARVLCAVDFSEASLGATQYASSLAQESGAGLTLLHVLEWPWGEPPAPRFEELPLEQALPLAEFRRYCMTSAEKRLESLIPEDFPGSRAAARVCSGTPHAQILSVAAEEQSDLIVIGVRGRSAMDLAFFGSTANHVVRGATCPVLTLR